MAVCAAVTTVLSCLLFGNGLRVGWRERGDGRGRGGVSSRHGFVLETAIIFCRLLCGECLLFAPRGGCLTACQELPCRRHDRAAISHVCQTCSDTAELRRTISPNCHNYCDTAEARRTFPPDCTTCCDTAETRWAILSNCTT